MEKLTNISIIHQLSRTGGTVFAKILGNSENMLLLSEVHPLRRGRDIRKQCWQFHKIAIPRTINSYVDCISFIKKNTQKEIIIRDFSHRDFLFKRCSLDLLSAKLLKDKFLLDRLALVRNPVDQFLSMKNFKPIKGYMSFEIFCRGYIAYYNAIRGIPIIRYEDLIKYPNEVLKTASSALKIDIPSQNLEAFNLNTKITGDNKDDGSRGFDLKELKKLPKRENYGDISEKMKKIPQMEEVLTDLQYR